MKTPDLQPWKERFYSVKFFLCSTSFAEDTFPLKKKRKTHLIKVNYSIKKIQIVKIITMKEAEANRTTNKIEINFKFAILIFLSV